MLLLVEPSVIVEDIFGVSLVSRVLMPQLYNVIKYAIYS